MAYTKVGWLNYEETGAKLIDKDNLGHMDDGIEANDTAITELKNIIGPLADLTTTDKTSIINAINELVSSASEVKYNLVTDGPTVKTGRKIDGKYEYAKRIATSIKKNMNETVDMGLPSDAIIHNYVGIISTGINSGMKVRDGFYYNATNYFSLHIINSIKMQIITGSATDWINASTMKCYIDVFFTLNEVQQSEEVIESE